MYNEDNFLDLVLSKCLDFTNTNSLLISYSSFNESFVKKLVARLDKKVGDIYLDIVDPFYEHDLLKKLTIDEIGKCDYFKKDIFNKYADKKANFLIIMSPVPGLMDDIEPEKLALLSKMKTESRQRFIEGESKDLFPWAIIPFANEYWAKDLGVNNLDEILYKTCLADDNYEENWNKYIKQNKKLCFLLNNYQFDYLLLRNEEGTNLKVGLPKDYEFDCVGLKNVFVNVPSYEIFTSPHRLKTNGIVYATKPLIYNGSMIENFYLEFKDGKVVKYDALKGKELLKSIIEFDDNSSYLGEVALVAESNAVNKSGLLFKTTLLDENASCHLALGRGFSKLPKENMLDVGINYSNIHVDFMIGSKSMKVVGIKDNEEIIIMNNGEFTLL